mmetsp:Transcript_122679/g.354622  ORF Transcript_122679/g.354622 Transcript_122679/m.354622 type:complete len:218 (-) Transcript_122679:136-789(-)
MSRRSSMTGARLRPPSSSAVAVPRQPSAQAASPASTGPGMAVAAAAPLPWQVTTSTAACAPGLARLVAGLNAESDWITSGSSHELDRDLRLPSSAPSFERLPASLRRLLELSAVASSGFGANSGAPQVPLNDIPLTKDSTSPAISLNSSLISAISCCAVSIKKFNEPQNQSCSSCSCGWHSLHKYQLHSLQSMTGSPAGTHRLHKSHRPKVAFRGCR